MEKERGVHRREKRLPRGKKKSSREWEHMKRR